MGTRKYCIDANGQEQPVWASKRKLQEMGRKWGAKAFANGQPAPLHYGNTVHDAAAQAEFDRLVELTGKQSSN